MKTIDALANTSPETRKTRAELMILTGLSDRAVREEISRLRHKQIWIISDTDRAGYYIGTQDQYNLWCRKMTHRAQNTFYRKDYSNERQVQYEASTSV